MTELAPYPEYISSGTQWVVDVPTNWRMRNLKALFRERKVRSRPTDEHLTPSQTYGVLPQAEYMAATGKKVVLNLTGSDLMRHVEPDDFISHLRSFQGGFEHSKLTGKVSAAYTVLEPLPGVIADFFRYLFKCSMYIQGLQTTTDQLRDGQSIRFAQATLLPLPVPDEQTQRDVADFLDRETAEIDAFIADQEELIGLLAERRAATITHAVTKGLDPSVPMKDSGVEWLGEVPTHWTVGRIGSSVASAKNGVWGEEPDGGNDIRCVRVADFDRPAQRVHDRDVTYRAITDSERRGRVLSRGDLLLEKSGGGEKSPVGFVVLYDRDEPAVTSNFVARVQLRPGMDARFWTYVHSSNYSRRLTARSVKQSTGIQNLDQSSYFSEAAPLPPSAEQSMIADYLDRETADLDATIADAREAIALSKERRAALISAAVTGKIDVRGHA